MPRPPPWLGRPRYQLDGDARLRWESFWADEVVMPQPLSATGQANGMLLPAATSHARPVSVSLMTRYTALLMDTHPYHVRTNTVIVRSNDNPVTVELPLPRHDTIERNDVPAIAREHFGWIYNMMMETMPVGLARVRDDYAATGQADQAMMLVDGAMRLGTFVELANASAEACGLDGQMPALVLQYWPATMELMVYEEVVPGEGLTTAVSPPSGDRPVLPFVYPDT